MEEATSFNTNSIEYNRKLLIATQGSEFKNQLTKNVVNHYKLDSIFIRVIDISHLEDIEPKSFNAILVLHTWESLKPPIVVETFMNNSIAHQNRIVVLTTSGNGSYKMEDIDAITGASNMANIDLFTERIIKRIDPLINTY